MLKKLLFIFALGFGLWSVNYGLSHSPLTLDNEIVSPRDLFLGQNYPNPAKNKTTIEMNFPGREATLRVFDVLGKQVEEISILDKKVLILDVSNYPEGIYLYTLEAGNDKITRRMTVKK